MEPRLSVRCDGKEEESWGGNLKRPTRLLRPIVAVAADDPGRVMGQGAKPAEPWGATDASESLAFHSMMAKQAWLPLARHVQVPVYQQPNRNSAPPVGERSARPLLATVLAPPGEQGA